MANIIINRKSRSWNRKKDGLHKRRRILACEIQDGIMSKSEMNRGNEGEPEFEAKVARYDGWKEVNEPKMKEFSEINREFKKHKEEGRRHSIDDLRPDGSKLIYD